MQRNIILQLKLYCVFFLLIVSVKLSAQRPNIIYMMTDDLGYADLSCYGRKDYKTPNLDKLASQGMMFTNAYAAAPVCTPTRVAFMTGRYPASIPLGLNEPIKHTKLDSTKGFTPDLPSIPAQLAAAGYKTYLVGKWHLGFQPQFSPLKNGYQYFFGFNGGAIDYVSHKAIIGPQTDLFENETPSNKKGYMTDLIMEKATEIIASKHTEPFFLSIMFNAPHWPWQGPQDQPYHDTMPFRAGGSKETFAAMMTSLDDAVGKIIKAVDDHKLSANTIIIFTSDNGGERFSDMGVYKGKKMQLWEGGIRVPAFVRWTGKIKPGTSTEQVATTMDWSTTFLSIAGINNPGTDGVNLLPILLQQKPAMERSLFWRITQHNQHKAARIGKWKYLLDEKGTEYLFDLEKDPSELNNLAAIETHQLNEMKTKYLQWESKMLKPITANE